MDIKHPIPKKYGTALLFAEHPLVIDPLLAVSVGLHEAIIIQQVHYWLSKNQNNRNNIREGRVWVYNSYKDWKRDLIFMSEAQIQRAFLSLEKQKIIISSKFDKREWSHKKWYTIDYVTLSKLQVPDLSGHANSHDRSNESASLNARKSATGDAGKYDHITETTTETSLETTTTTAAAVDALLIKLHRELQLDAEVRSWVTNALTTKGEEYTASNIEATMVQANKQKPFLRKALQEDFGETYRAKWKAARERERQADQNKAQENSQEHVDTIQIKIAREIYNSLPDADKEEILAEARETSPSKLRKIIEARVINIVMKKFMSAGQINHIHYRKMEGENYEKISERAD